MKLGLRRCANAVSPSRASALPATRASACASSSSWASSGVSPAVRRSRRVSPKARVDAEWQAFVARKKAEELDQIIADEGLKADETKAFVDNAFRDGAIPTTGTAITKILPPVSRFSKNNNHSAKKQTVLDKLAAFFERYFGLG